jgi:long-chain acyl-CoA synthetase
VADHPTAPSTSLDVVSAWLHRGDAPAGARLAVATRVGQRWSELTYGDLDLRSAALAAELASAGVEPGDRVALLAGSSGDWVAAFLGILRRGATAVPLDTKLTVEELVGLRQRSDLTAAVVGSALAERWTESTVADDGLRVPVLDPAHVSAGGVTDTSADRERPLDEPAVLVWTSGTTGTPKGVTLSLANLAYVVGAACAVQDADRGSRWLSVLPPNHLLELCCGLLPALAAGSPVFVAQTVLPHELRSLMAECRVNLMVVVPMILRMMKRQIESECRRRGPAGAYLRAAMVVARVPSTRGRRLLFAPVHRRLGGHLRAFYCGGAPLDPEVARFFEHLGIGVHQGYGLTEAGPTVAMNSPSGSRVGSVGRPIPGTVARIGSDGEILVRGPGVMLGYWRDERATAEAVDRDGWLHTGDLGRLDGDGYLFVTGRTKSLIVLESGKKVQPEEVEAALAASALFQESCVVGWRPPDTGGRAGEQVCAVVVPAAELTEAAAADEVRRLSLGLSAFKRPTVVRVHTGPLPETAKRSVRRVEVVRLLDRASQGRVRP